MEAERRRSLRKSLRPLASSVGFAFVCSVVVNASARSQRRLAISGSARFGAIDEGTIARGPAQAGALLGKKVCQGSMVMLEELLDETAEQ